MMANSSETSYFSFPSYKSHFNSEIQAEQLTPVTPTPFYMALEPLVDVSTEAYPIIQRDSYHEAQTHLLQVLAAASLASISQQPGSIYQSSESFHLAPVPSSLLGLHPLVNPSKAGGDPLKRVKSATTISQRNRTAIDFPDCAHPTLIIRRRLQATISGSPESRLHQTPTSWLTIPSITQRTT
ncbi:hypothetical protein H4Q26_010970 [Puccinia striiformis f. sp. tritici PST-130]|nr:hypothetical protein H4Q26_010970 [Puccinia striiformis f. sp. tritici PST-130]